MSNDNNDWEKLLRDTNATKNRLCEEIARLRRAMFAAAQCAHENAIGAVEEIDTVLVEELTIDERTYGEINYRLFDPSTPRHENIKYYRGPDKSYPCDIND